MKLFKSSSTVMFLTIILLSFGVTSCDDSSASVSKSSTYISDESGDQGTSEVQQQEEQGVDTTDVQDQSTSVDTEYPGYIKGFIVDIEENWLLFEADDAILYQINCPSGRFLWFENKMHWKFRIRGIITDEISEETGAHVFDIEWFALDTASPQTFAFGYDYDYPVTVTGTLKYSELDGWKYYEFYGDDGIGYLITNIPEEFRVDGIRVRVTFHFPSSPCSGIMWGIEVLQSEIVVVGVEHIENRENEEAELMAMFLSGKIIAPDDLYSLVEHDLKLIRSTYAMDYDFLDIIHFRLPWAPGCILIKVDNSTAQDIMNDEYHEWDCLNESFGIRSIEKILEYAKLVVLTSQYRINPIYLKEAYQNLPGVEYVSLNGIIGDGSKIYPRMVNDKMTYLFYRGNGDCPAGCTEKFYIYFEVKDDNVCLIGEYDSSNPERPEWWDEAYENINFYRSRSN